MREIRGDMFAYIGREKFRLCITTNGFVKNDGTAVMGRGNAALAKKIWNDDFNMKLEEVLGKAILRSGNKMHKLDTQLYSFPVKVNWWDKASTKLISKSVDELKERANNNKEKVFVLARPGCGNGGLKWKNVKPLLASLPDNVWVITRWDDPEWGKDVDGIQNKTTHKSARRRASRRSVVRRKASRNHNSRRRRSSRHKSSKSTRR